MYRICKRFDFEAAHSLPFLPVWHKCHHVHGHSYKVWLFLESEGLDCNNFVVDFDEMSLVKEWLDRNFDHKNLNDVIRITTCEAIAAHLFSVFSEFVPKLKKVRVSETDKTWGEYENI